jgi:hypothetical protein
LRILTLANSLSMRLGGLANFGAGLHVMPAFVMARIIPGMMRNVTMTATRNPTTRAIIMALSLYLDYRRGFDNHIYISCVSNAVKKGLGRWE